jgi:hypothetical protein
MPAQSNTAAPTVYDLAYALRNRLLSDHTTREAAGALTFLCTAWAALQCRAARLAAQQPQPTPPAAGFAPIARRAIFDELVAAYDYARSVAPAGAWQNAIARAWDYLLEAEVYHFDAERHALRVESASEAGKVYEANAACQCRAHELGNPCWHRCAARIIARALELRDLAAEIAADQGVSPARALEWAAAQIGELSGYAHTWDQAAEQQRLAALPPVAERRAALVARISGARAATLARAA